ncbi:ABC transporter permease [Streptomyces spirodelae]|uniref:ABC transporter permease n=1 Tax=Streptomyces spirodelae TaxID=2812904 RepID=A0ABS3WWJ1_9ACTN|nr:ABC transporter permease [Streptomyces spirodelae]MBO8187511.1 ABC transporter permease [Streptomyces spirodelae]
MASSETAATPSGPARGPDSPAASGGAAPAAVLAPARGGGTAAAIRAEWTKVRTLRSTLALLVGTFLASIGLALLSGVSVGNALAADNGRVRPDFHPVDSGFNIVWYTQLGLVAFGVLLISGEFGSGMIRVSLAAVPRRARLYLAKAGVCAAVTLPLAALTVVLSFLIDQAGLGEYGVGVDEPGVLRGMLLGAVYLTLIALLAFGMATAVRSTAVALGALYVFLFALSPLSQAVPGLKEAARYLPDKAGIQALKVGADADPALGPWGGILVVAGWTALALLAGWFAFRRREV